MVGCDCCKNPCQNLMRVRSIIDDEYWGEAELLIEDNSLVLTLNHSESSLTHSKDIKFCPMCGRELEAME